MDSQHSFYYPSSSPFQQGSKPRYIPKQHASWWLATSRMAPLGGTDMMPTLSDQSTHSTRSGFTDATDLSVPSINTMSSSYDAPSPSFDYESGNSPSYVPVYPASSSFTAGSYGQASPSSFGRYEQERRETPSSLGWNEDSVLPELYNFVVIKGKEPYLELQPNYRVTDQTPVRVYLDRPTNTQKGLYPCQFPGCQTMKPTKPFHRPADLERHYRNVHASADQKERFECDYPKCDRATDPFTRKDHYRDHLRDYHKEDLGQAKRAKNEDRKKWDRAQETWLAERNISSHWWRCAKCLTRARVDVDGWDCNKCNGTCEPDRVARRQSKREGSHSYSYDPAAYSFEPGCSTCNGAVWVDNGHGDLMACPSCGFEASGGQEFYYETETGDGIAYHPNSKY